MEGRWLADGYLIYRGKGKSFYIKKWSFSEAFSRFFPVDEHRYKSSILKDKETNYIFSEMPIISRDPNLATFSATNVDID